MVMVVLQERSSVLVAPLLVGWRLEFLMAVVVGILVVDSLTRMVDFLLKAVAQSFLGTLLVLPMVVLGILVVDSVFPQAVVHLRLFVLVICIIRKLPVGSINSVNFPSS